MSFLVWWFTTHTLGNEDFGLISFAGLKPKMGVTVCGLTARCGKSM